jgi:hypothetical protein
VIGHPVENMLEPTGFLANLDQAVEVGREIVALFLDRFRQRSTLANAVRDRPHVSSVLGSSSARFSLENPKRVVPDVECDAHALAKQAQIAIADACDHYRSSVNRRQVDRTIPEDVWPL